jgi:hypothetical protein
VGDADAHLLLCRIAGHKEMLYRSASSKPERPVLLVGEASRFRVKWARTFRANSRRRKGLDADTAVAGYFNLNVEQEEAAFLLRRTRPRIGLVAMDSVQPD